MFETFCVVLFVCFVVKFAVGVIGNTASVLSSLVSLSTQRQANRQMRRRDKMGLSPFQQLGQEQGPGSSQEDSLDAHAREFIKDSCSRPRPKR